MTSPRWRGSRATRLIILLLALLLQSTVQGKLVLHSDKGTITQLPLSGNLTPGSVLVSAPNGIFAFGFFSTAAGFGNWGIWYNQLEEAGNHTVVWMPQRDVNLSGAASLQLSQDGVLLLRDTVNNVPVDQPVWTSKNTLPGTELELKDDGNLVLLNATLGIVWQSFDTPTDTLLPGQALSAAQNRPLVAWRGADDWSEGYYFCAWLQINGTLSITLYWNGKSIPAWNQSSWSGNASIGANNATVYPYVVIDYTGSDMKYTLDNSSAFYARNESNGTFYAVMSLEVSQGLGRVTLDRDGVLRLYSASSANSWTSPNVMNIWPRQPCAVYAECGPYGVCSSDSGTYLGTCLCSEGFVYIDPGDQYKGCKRAFPLPADVCAVNTSNLVMKEVVGINNVDLDFPYADKLIQFDNVNESWCVEQCWHDCRCAGAIFWKGDASHRCYVKSDPLFNGGYLSDQLDHFSYVRNHSAFLKVMNITSSITTRSKQQYVIIGASVAVGVAVVCLAMVLAKWKYWQRRRMQWQPGPSNLDLTLIGPRRFTLKELSAATNNFSQSELIGSGGMGSVYKGVYKDAIVAVKRIRHEARGSEKGFVDEASSISQIRHRNLVQLKGWCIEDGRFLLVYDYMANGSLDQWLYDRGPGRSQRQRSRKELSWSLRYSILTDIAAALEYLHEDWQQCVLHRDIKSGNVLLDAEFNAHLGDFGLARLIDHQKMEKTTMMAGTFGYMAPEMPYTGKATKETDVYSFGVLMLEVVCGKKPVDSFTDLDNPETDPEDVVLLHRVRRAHQEGNLLATIDPRLRITTERSNSSKNGTHPERKPDAHVTSQADSADGLARRIDDERAREEEQMMLVLKLGLLCCLPIPCARPSIRLVRQVLTGDDTTLPALPDTSQWTNLDALGAFHDEFLGPQLLQESRSFSSSSSSKDPTSLPASLS